MLHTFAKTSTGVNSSYLKQETVLSPGIELKDVEKHYIMGNRQSFALKNINLQILPGEFVAIVGPSGSGKSTILNMITGIDKPTVGSVTVAGKVLDRMSENKLAKWRGNSVGIVFQFFQLLPTLTALENVTLPMHLRGKASQWQGEEKRKRGIQNLEMVGLSEHSFKLPGELSGGEQQRVAIARALANDPPIIVADEPTGNLDSETGKLVFEILQRLSQEGKTIIYVTHDLALSRSARRLIQIRDGLIVTDTTG